MSARLASLLPSAFLGVAAAAAVPLVPPTTSVLQENGVADTAPAPVGPAVQVHQAAPLARTVTVRPGDTLSAIAGRVCGNPGDYLALAYNNNVPNPDLIYSGQVFKIACEAAAQAIASRYAPPPSPPASPPVRPSAPAAVVTSVSGTYHGSSSMQQCIIARESGGNPRAVNPASGAGGLYQFLPSTWRALGHSGLPENAPVAEQNQAFAQEVAQDGGYSAWQPYDGCLRVP